MERWIANKEVKDITLSIPHSVKLKNLNIEVNKDIDVKINYPFVIKDFYPYLSKYSEENNKKILNYFLKRIYLKIIYGNRIKNYEKETNLFQYYINNNNSN